MVTSRDRSGFSRPHTEPPVAAVYRMLNPRGMAKGHTPHFHPDTIEVCFVRHGHLEWWASDEAFEIGSGDVLVIPPGVPHGSVDSTLQPCEYYAMHLIPEELSPSLQSIASRLQGLYPRQPEAGDFVRRVFEEYRLGYDLLPETGAALVTILLASLERLSRTAELQANPIVRRAQEALERDGLTIEAAAREQGVSSVWLTHLFRREVGESPGDWLRARRLATAKRLLALDRISVTEIAFRLGYNSSQAFATAFRQQCGLTPTVYRERCAETWTARSNAVCAPTR